MSHRIWLVSTLILSLLLFPSLALAQDGITLEVPADIVAEAEGPDGAVVTYTATASDMEDGELTPDCSPASGSLFGLGMTTVTCTATDSDDNSASASFDVNVVDTTPPTLTGPGDMTVETTDPDGAVVTYVVEATDIVDGELVADCDPPSGSMFPLGDTVVTCTATDAADNEGTLSFTVSVIQVSCHPMAERIAEAVSALFDEQAMRTYTCEDIVEIWRGVFSGDVFENYVTGMQVGLGRMWHAYQLTMVIEDLVWEEILDWHLGGNGWGLLLQLNKFAEALDGLDIRYLMDLLEDGVEVRDIRHAVRMVTRFDAEFRDALDRLTEDGTSPGQLAQFYALVQELGEEPAVLDGYLAQGASLADIRHAFKSFGDAWAAALDYKLDDHSWGEINQAYRLAGEEGDPQDILEMGVQEYRRQQREGAQTQRQSDRDASTAARLARQFGVSVDQVWVTYAECDSDWQCVRDFYRQQARGNRGRGPH